MALTSGLRPNAWRVLSRTPFSPVYGIETPTPHERHPFFNEISEYPLQRVPTAKNRIAFHTNRSINHVAALIAATGQQLPDHLACRPCRRPTAGQWKGCFIPASPNFIQEFRFGCANGPGRPSSRARNPRSQRSMNVANRDCSVEKRNFSP